MQPPFFGVEVFNGDKLIYGSKDFSCKIDLNRESKVCRYSRQRGFIEKQRLDKEKFVDVPIYPVSSPVILNGVGDTCSYPEIFFEKIEEKEYKGFESTVVPGWEYDKNYQAREGDYDIDKDFLNIKEGYKSIDYKLSSIKTGFMKVEIDSNEDGDFYIAFDEVLNDGKWMFRRAQCNDIFVYTYGKGHYVHMSAEPYTMRYIKVIYKGDIKIKPSLILYENSKSNFISYSGDEKVVSILDAAKNTFSQNAVDIFTDCAGRERAGWLCDSFFTARAEQLFMGNNNIERNYLENIIIANTDEITEGMIPMCFPSQQDNNLFIPNWAMWFVVELKDYYDRTGDYSLVARGKEKVYRLIKYFEKFKCIDGLLNNLENWIFVEWSIANDADYVKGVNFPSNMLYSTMLKYAGELYNDEELINEAKRVKEGVIKYSFNGTFFVDNGEYTDGKIIPYENHISETCQYYALFFHIYDDEKYANFIMENFGPNRKEGFENIGKSNVFIGNYLRLLWLCDIKENERVLNESIEYFYKMSKETKTLWEHDSPHASCNHGFASVIAVILLRVLIGYKGVKNGKMVLEDGFKKSPLISVSTK